MSDTNPRFDANTFIASGALVGPRAPFNIAKLANTTKALIASNWVLVVTITACIDVLPNLTTAATHLYFHSKYGDEESAYAVLNYIQGTLEIVPVLVLPFVLTWALVRRFDGEKLSIASLASVLAPSLILGILAGLGTMLGLLLLIVPGLILLVRWSVAGVVVISERKSALLAMGRSADLVEGCYWPIFGALISCLILSTAWDMIVTTLGSVLLGIWPDHHIDWIVSAVLAPWGALPLSIVPIALYFHTRELKEGATDTTIAEAFD